jgi:paraquat-inducible protein B
MSAADPAIFIPRATPIKPSILGGFILSGLVLAVTAILLFGRIDLFRPTEQAVVIFLDSISGLAVGAPVSFRGVQVGSVRRIAIDLDRENTAARVFVTLELDRNAMRSDGDNNPDDPTGLDRLVRAGLVAQLDTSSLITGQLEVELDLRPEINTAVTRTASGIPEIPAVASPFASIKTQIEQLQVRQLVDNTQRTLESIRRVSDLLGEKIGPLMDSVQKASDEANGTLRVAAGAIETISSEANRTLRDFDGLALVGQRQLTGRGAELSRVLVDAGHTVRELNTLSVSLNDMVSPRSQTRGDFDAAVRDLSATASSLRDFSREIDRDPSLLLTKGIRP